MIREYTSDCVHCGFCLPTCPTYVLWREEMDSPRGRIHLMDARLDGTIALNARCRALRPLPRLHGVRLLVPVGRALRPPDRVDARRRRAARSSDPSETGSCGRSSSGCSRIRGACARRSGSRRSAAAPLPSGCGRSRDRAALARDAATCLR